MQSSTLFRISYELRPTSSCSTGNLLTPIDIIFPRPGDHKGAFSAVEAVMLELVEIGVDKGEDVSLKGGQKRGNR